jgi:hypothetical protein
MWDYVSYKDYLQTWQKIDNKSQLPKSLLNKKSTPKLTPERLFASTPDLTPNPTPKDLTTPIPIPFESKQITPANH